MQALRALAHTLQRTASVTHTYCSAARRSGEGTTGSLFHRICTSQLSTWISAGSNVVESASTTDASAQRIAWMKNVRIDKCTWWLTREEVSLRRSTRCFASTSTRGKRDWERRGLISCRHAGSHCDERHRCSASGSPAMSTRRRIVSTSTSALGSGLLRRSRSTPGVFRNGCKLYKCPIHTLAIHTAPVSTRPYGIHAPHSGAARAARPSTELPRSLAQCTL